MQPGPGAHRLGMGLIQGQVYTGRCSMTCVYVFVQAGDRISGSCMRPRLRPRLRVANHQKWEMTQERVPSESQIGSSGPDAAVFQF